MISNSLSNENYIEENKILKDSLIVIKNNNYKLNTSNINLINELTKYKNDKKLISNNINNMDDEFMTSVDINETININEVSNSITNNESFYIEKYN